MTLRLGVLGGTFDPIHVVHLVAAVNVRHTLQLDRVLVVVASQPWQKADRQVTPAEDRYALVEAAVGDVDGVEASRMEIDRGGASYTADTIAELAELHPDAELFLIVGADVADDLDTWDRIDAVRERTQLVVVNRPGAPMPPLMKGWRATQVEIPNLEISSTDLRARAGDGRPLDYLVPAAAVHCIKERGLYARCR